jgi:hypothetical protein
MCLAPRKVGITQDQEKQTTGAGIWLQLESVNNGKMWKLNWEMSGYAKPNKDPYDQHKPEAK